MVLYYLPPLKGIVLINTLYILSTINYNSLAHIFLPSNTSVISLFCNHGYFRFTIEPSNGTISGKDGGKGLVGSASNQGHVFSHIQLVNIVEPHPHHH
jgi:hypothetical protein